MQIGVLIAGNTGFVTVTDIVTTIFINFKYHYVNDCQFCPFGTAALTGNTELTKNGKGDIMVVCDYPSV